MFKRIRVVWTVVTAAAGTLLCFGLLTHTKPVIPDITVAVSPISTPAEPLAAPKALDQPMPGESPQTPVQDSVALTTSPPIVDPDRERTARLDNTLNRLSADYSKSFRPGVFMEDPMPEFAVQSLQSTILRDRDLVAESQHLQSPIDAWSLEMEGLLRKFFESQPELATVRVGISCRAAQCVLQTVTPAEADAQVGGLPQQFLDRLKQEKWYQDNFSRGASMASSDRYRYWMQTFVRQTGSGK